MENEWRVKWVPQLSNVCTIYPQGSTVRSRTHLTMTWANTVRPCGYTSANAFTNDVLIQPPR